MDCRQGSSLIIKQIGEILSRMNDGQYTKELDLFNGSTIGHHMRHIYDFYYSIVKSLEIGELDYADRDRNPDIERYTHNAALNFITLAKLILTLDEDTLIDVVTEFETEHEKPRKRVSSSIGRELLYAYDHAIHHLAIVKMGIKTNFPDFEIDPNMGIAPSTIKHNKQQAIK